MLYYHALVGIKEKDKSGNFIEYVQYDRTLQEIDEKIVYPYVNNTSLDVNGYIINPSDINRFIIKMTQKKAQEYLDNESIEGKSDYVVAFRFKRIIFENNDIIDVKSQLLDNAMKNNKTPSNYKIPDAISSSNKIFIVHGRDDAAKESVARLVERLGYEAIILHEQANEGKTIIEKFEINTDVGFAIVLYTPCDIGGLKDGNKDNQRLRARQNVIFEHGFLIGKLGRDRVCALVKDNIEKPSDIDGIVYIPMDNSQAWHMSVGKELKKVGYKVDLNKLV
jgi:putative nucleotide-binding protein containing TIR-like domain